MELVGKAVRKASLGFGIFSGSVESYNPDSGVFKIVYEDGNSEVMEIAQVASILDGNEGKGTAERKKRGRKPKKRRRVGELDAGGVSGISAYTQMRTNDFGDTQMMNFENNRVDVVDLKGRVSVVETQTKGYGSDVDLGGNRNTSHGVIGESEMKCLGFDVVLEGKASSGVFNEGEEKTISFAVELRGSDPAGLLKETQMKESYSGTNFKKITTYGLGESVRGTQAEAFALDRNVKGDASSGTAEESETKGCDLGEYFGGITSIPRDKEILHNGDTKPPFQSEVHSKEEVQENIFLTPNKAGRDSSKRRRLTEKQDSRSQPPLRRSTRRATANSPYSPNHTLDSEKSPIAISLSDGESVGGLEYAESEEKCGLPLKLALPASSNNLNINELPIFDVFSVYACLRSFSTLLFLSPFTLEAFVAALKCTFANSLIDSIYFSILRTLRSHMEVLSAGGSESASKCLRNLNWIFLDSVTWPVYLAEYLLVCSSGFKSVSKLSCLKLLDGEYYKQPARVKLDLLGCICDDVIEAEVIRSELDRRTSTTQLDIMDMDRLGEAYTKKKGSTDNLRKSGLAEQNDDVGDPNSDECCICKMDGSLICCDGCPAAYHLRCVGMAKDLLPDGDWYCLECVMKKHDGWMKSSNPLRGADLLGIDSYGRLYFGSCGYLLVSDSCEPEPSYYYYHRNDLPSVIEVLKSDIMYSGLIGAISAYWDSPSQFIGVENHSDHRIQLACINLSKDVENSDAVKEGALDGERMISSVLPDIVGLQSCKAATPTTGPDSTTVTQCMEVANSFTSVKVSTKSSIAHLEESPEKIQMPIEDLPLKPIDPDIVQEKIMGCAVSVPTALKISPKNKGGMEIQLEPTLYINYYSFGQMASSVAEELTSKSSDDTKGELNKSAEETISLQLKAISKRSTKFCWSNIHKLHVDAQKENCGWCFSCRTGDRECLFSMNEMKVPKVSKTGAVGLRTKRSKKTHLSSVTHHILSIENRLNGLLSGPWENPQHSKQWRKRILKASDVAAVIPLFLILESNVRRIALLPEWSKPVDSDDTVGSASYILTSSGHVSSKHGGGKKRARKNVHLDAESVFVSQIAAKSGIQWWRGGRLSRRVFSWKMLPRSLACIGARQGGWKKIPGIFYPDASEFAKRSKYITWRAGVEMSTSVAQLAYQVRDLDGNIRWRDLAEKGLFPKESKKLFRPLKNVTLRKKCVEGTEVKYLLDFGKRKIVPDTVTRHGVFLEDSSNERKKYWLCESYVPLNLLKAFEERKLARKVNKKNKIFDKTDFGLLCEESGNKKKPSRHRGLSVLLSKGQKEETSKRDLEQLCESGKRKKATRQKGVSRLVLKGEKDENYLCGHCNKDVSARDALSCRFCKGFFHKRHIKASEGTATAKLTYTCHKCQKKKQVKIKITIQKAKLRSANSKTSRKKPPSKKKNLKPLKHESLGGKSSNKCKSGGKRHSKGEVSNITKKEITWHKRQRTQVDHAYWSNGLHWTRKLSNDRGIHFRQWKVLLPLQQDSKVSSLKPMCSLCHEGYDSELIFIGCENCEDWFHGDAWGLAADNINNLIGFRCHSCRVRNSPRCPRSDVAVRAVQLIGLSNDEGSDCVIDHTTHNEVQGESSSVQGAQSHDGGGKGEGTKCVMDQPCDSMVSRETLETRKVLPTDESVDREIIDVKPDSAQTLMLEQHTKRGEDGPFIIQSHVQANYHSSKSDGERSHANRRCSIA